MTNETQGESENVFYYPFQAKADRVKACEFSDFLYFLENEKGEDLDLLFSEFWEYQKRFAPEVETINQ